MYKNMMYTKLEKEFYFDVERKAQFYILTSVDSLRCMIDSIYDFKTNLLKINTDETISYLSTSELVLFNLALNLYNPALGNPI